MYTSNFARLRRLPEGLRPISIALSSARWYKGAREGRLAPARAMLDMARPDYDRAFQEILDGLNPGELYEQLGDNAVLLCWESPGIWCHRRLVAEWFEDALGIVVPEFGFARDATPCYQDLPAKDRRGKGRK